MVELWYLSPQWMQSLKISKGLLRHGPGIGVPQPSDVNLVTADKQARQPYLATCLLLHKHRIQYWGQPVFKFAIVIVWHNEVTNTIHAAPLQVSTIKIEVSKIYASKALDEYCQQW